ncbi:MAG: Gfo/Idh/MocA family oxidoreductase [Candidatus Acidiferrales bacterium]
MTPSPVRVAVVGVGDFGRNHVRVWRELPGATLVGIVDLNPDRAKAVADEFQTTALSGVSALRGNVDAVSLAVPTIEHARLGCFLLEQGIDLLVEKPIAGSLDEADALIASAKRADRILQVGHLERFNPAVVAAEKIVTRPLFFEVHRLGVFSPRSLDVDVVYDLMIHDLDILLALLDSPVTDLRAVGIPVITDKIDIAHARLEFASGAVANLTASRVSTEKVRKMRFFQEHEYISLDFTRQDALRVRVNAGSDSANRDSANPFDPSNLAGGLNDSDPRVNFEKLPVAPEEPLRAELREFLDAVRTRQKPRVDGAAARRALALAYLVMQGILEHSRRVQLGAFAPQDSR